MPQNKANWLFQSFHCCANEQLYWIDFRDEWNRLVERRITSAKGERIDDVHVASISRYPNTLSAENASKFATKKSRSEVLRV